MSKLAAASFVISFTFLLPIQLFDHVSALSLFHFEQSVFERLIKDKRLLLADEMGLRKTVQCIEPINKVEKQDADVLIICPKSVLGVWENEIQTWLDPSPDFDLEALEPKAFPESKRRNAKEFFSFLSLITICATNFVITSEQMNTMYRFATRRTISNHWLPNVPKKYFEFGNGADNGGINSEYLWLRTGTPVLNRPVELFPFLRAINPNEFGNFKEYNMRYCHPRTIEDRRGNFGKDYSGAANLFELSKVLEPFMLRRCKTDALSQFPNSLHCIQMIPMRD